jgi:hypothetical protein
MKIDIPENYGIGGETLKRAQPWLTPGSLYRIDELLCRVSPVVLGEDKVSYNWQKTKKWIPKFKALEFGSGGSTLFLAQRCTSVISFETNENWKRKVEEELKKRKLNNVEIRMFSGKNDLFNKISTLSSDIGCALVDNDWKIARRDEVFFKTIPKLRKDKAIVIFDNYASTGCFPTLDKHSPQQIIDEYLGEGWQGEDYPSIFWGGIGTRVFHKGITEMRYMENSCRWINL